MASVLRGDKAIDGCRVIISYLHAVSFEHFCVSGFQFKSGFCKIDKEPDPDTLFCFFDQRTRDQGTGLIEIKYRELKLDGPFGGLDEF
jgi:hypothetical protein